MKVKTMFTIIAMLLVVFMAGCKKDEDPGMSSTVISTDPANNATGVVLDKAVTALFSTPMDPSTLTTMTFTIKNGSISVPGAVSYSDSTATFTPSGNFLPDSIYTATIKTGAKNMSGIPMEKDYVWKFTIGTSPSVTSVDPSNNASGIVFNKVVTATFSAPMDPLTFTATSFTLKQGATSVPGTVAYNGTTASFTPSSDLIPNTIYTGTITTGVKNVTGIPLANNYVWTFHSGIVPTVNSTNPANDATGIALTKIITATFNAPMDPLTLTGITFTLKHGVTLVSGAVTCSGSIASFTPSSNLLPGTTYSGTITTGAKNVPGIPMGSNFVWTFTTGAMPTVVSTDPVNQAAGVALNKVISAGFSGVMDPLTITTSSFTLKIGAASVAGTVSYTGTTAFFTPSVALTPSTIYTGTITTGAKNVPGIPLANNYTWSFTSGAGSDIILPLVNSTNPLNNTTGVALNRIVALTFSEAMAPLTINTSTFTLKQGTTPVTGTVAYSGTTATFTPTNILAASTIYTATITTGATDLAGNPLEANIVWNFTTGSTLSGLTAVNLGTAGNYVILAKTAINNIAISAITGDLGLSPAATSYITGLSLTDATGYATSAQVTGKVYAADMVSPTSTNLTTAVENMITAYNDAAGRPTPDFLELATGNIGGKTLTPGLYKWTNSVTLPSNVTISGSATDVWIFQIAGNLLMSSAVNVTLVGGALPQNIFWQVAGQVTFGSSSHFEGIILSMTGITFQTGASMKGRALAQTAVILDGNAITKP